MTPAQRKQHNATKRIQLITLRERIFDKYGGKCACCEEADRRFLSIDHINNDGAKHRRQTGSTSGLKLYRWIIRNSFPANLQLLCFNCNDAKQRFGGICPHESDRLAAQAERKRTT